MSVKPLMLCHGQSQAVGKASKWSPSGGTTCSAGNSKVASLSPTPSHKPKVSSQKSDHSNILKLNGTDSKLSNKSYYWKKVGSN